METTMLQPNFWRPESPFLAQLLDQIGARQQADHQALRAIAQRTLDDKKLGYQHADAPDGRIYVLTKPDLALFIYEAGVEIWHATTWLDFDQAGKLMGDTLMPVVGGAPAARHVELAEHVWNAWAESAGPAMAAGAPVIGVRLVDAALLLNMARRNAKTMPAFQEMAAEQMLNLMSCELLRHASTPAMHDGPSTATRPPAQRRPRL